MTIFTRQLQQDTQDYNNTHKTTTTIHMANQQQSPGLLRNLSLPPRSGLESRSSEVLHSGRQVEASWNVMTHAQKPLSAKRTSPFKSAGASVQSTTGSRGVRISGSNAGYAMFRGSVKGTGYPLHSPVSPSLPHPASPCAITFQLESNSLLSFRNNLSVQKRRLGNTTTSSVIPQNSAVLIQKCC